MMQNKTKKEQAPVQNTDNEFENFRTISPGRLVVKRFFRSKLSVLGLVVLISIFLFVLVGPVIVNYIDQNSDYGYGLTKEKQAYLEAVKNGDPIPAPDPAKPWLANKLETRKYNIERRSPMLSLGSFYGPDGFKYSYYDKSISTITAKYAPDVNHLLGTDVNGMDAFVRLMYGGQKSLMIAFIVIIMETVIGVFMGGLAGYFGKWVDQIIMRVVDVFLCIPTLPVLLVLSSIIASIDSISAADRILWLMAALTLLDWAGMARIVRGQILLLREQEYMMSAEASGLPAWRKIFVHLLPNVLPQIIVSVTMGLGGIIIWESSLSWLGLGVQFPAASWGGMINQANPSSGQDILTNFPNLWIPAGLLIVLTVLAFNFIGDGLRDAFDPKARR